MPTSLKSVYCGNNKLTTLPTSLPTSLEVLICGENRLTTLPTSLPSSLRGVYCGNNKLTTLPVELFYIKKYIHFYNKDVLFQVDATNRIMKWYNSRKTLKRTIVAKKVYDNTSIPKDLCFLISRMT